MLVGQDIGLTESLLITVVGMGVVLLELGILSLGVNILSRGVKSFAGRAAVPAAPAVPAALAVPAPPPAVAAAPVGDVCTDEELSCVIAATLEESGLAPEQITITSIEVK